MRARLCWNDHADKSEKEGTFQRKYRMKRRTFKKLVALRSSETTVNTLYLRFRRHSKLICTAAVVRVEPIKYVYVFYKCYNRWTDSVCVADGHI